MVCHMIRSCETCVYVKERHHMYELIISNNMYECNCVYIDNLKPQCDDHYNIKNVTS